MFFNAMYEVMCMPPADTHLIPDNYTPVGDLVVVAICLVMLALISFSYIRRTAGFRIFMCIIPCLMAAALLNVTCHRLAFTMGVVPVVYACSMPSCSRCFSSSPYTLPGSPAWTGRTPPGS